MDRRTFLVAASALTIATTAHAQALPQGAEAAVTEADARASASNRRLLVIFHASWCVYCRLFDMMLKDKEAGPIIDRHFVVLHLRAQERKPEMQAQQLAGADDVYHRYAPDGTGLPYMVVLGDGAKKVSDSMISGENFGFPVEPQELDAFDAMMKAGASDITPAELRKLRRTCKDLIKQKDKA
ncbi:MAG: thioredoxin family protein [Alphaproteobacteria bacterium]